MLLLLIFIIPAVLSVSVLGEEKSCLSDSLRGRCLDGGSSCSDEGYDAEACRHQTRHISLSPTQQIDRKMTVMKPRLVKRRRPLIKMRNPIRSMIRRRKRRPSTYNHQVMMGQRHKSPTHPIKTVNNHYSNNIVQSHSPYGKYSEKTLSYYHKKQIASNEDELIDSTGYAKPNDDLRPHQYHAQSSHTRGPSDGISMYGESPVDLGAGKPSSSDHSMYPEEPDIFKNSNLFDAMFRPRKPTHTSRRIAELKCDEFKKISTETIAELSKYGMIPKKVERCSLAEMDIKTPSGIAMKAEFPHVVGLGYDDDGDTVWGCGGALISEQYVLTAGHCVFTPLGRPSKVEVGETHLGSRTTAHELRISEISVHPLYNATGRFNDIALIRLARRVRFSDSIRPACLQSGRYYDVASIGTHWEPIETMSLEVRLRSNFSTHRFSDGSETVGIRKAPYSILDTSECGIPQDTADSLLCLRTTMPGPTCSSEGGGGPLQVKQGANRCMYSIIGVSSMKSCEDPTMAIYTRVAYFLPWIESIVWA